MAKAGGADGGGDGIGDVSVSWCSAPYVLAGAVQFADRAGRTADRKVVGAGGRSKYPDADPVPRASVAAAETEAL